MGAPKNVLWIVIDQLRYDTPGFNRNSICKTPCMDRLARSGVNFHSRVYALQPVHTGTSNHADRQVCIYPQHGHQLRYVTQPRP